MRPALQFCRLSTEDKRELTSFFTQIVANGDSRWFHPHPFTQEEADRLCSYDGRDLYYVARAGKEILAYGMLRGWDKGYDVPSLGIIVHQRARGYGLGSTFMHFLHSAARYQGARQVRLKVYRDNEIAWALYMRLGYCFEKGEGSERIGYFNFPQVAGEQ